jgi:hypothetical protein
MRLPIGAFFMPEYQPPADLQNALIAAIRDSCHKYPLLSHAFSEGCQMATEYLSLLAVLAGIAGFALYKHFKSQKKSTLLRPHDR